MALPALAAVRAATPSATLVVAARPSVAPLFRMVQGVDEVVEEDRRAPFPERLRKSYAIPFDAAILLPNSFHSALVARRAGIRERWGYRTDWRGPLLTRAVPPPPADTHQVERYEQLVRALGFPCAPGAPQLDVGAAARAAGLCALQRAGWDARTPFVVLAPGAAYGGSRRWPPDRFAAIASSLAHDAMQVALVGSPADLATGRTVQAAVREPSAVLNLVGQTDLPALVGVLAHARALVSNDSGAMHLGAAIGLPLAAILGPTDERVTGPRQSATPDPGADRRLVVLKNPVWCSPCRLRECPIGHRCMRGIAVDAVLAAVRQIL